MTKKLQSITNRTAPILALAAIILIWLLCSDFEVVPAYMLPSPIEVGKAFIDNFTIMLGQAAYTLQEAIYGLGIGIVLAFIVATLMDRFPFIYKAVYPILIITQTIPTIAIAPLLVLWMGFGMAPKITLVVITTFFPISIGLLEGFQSADADEINMMRSMGANRLQIFRHIKLPSATGSFFSGLRISASYAVVGAVISEWLGGFYGLGVYMTRVKKAYAFDKMFAVIVFISVISLLLMAFISALQKTAMPWERRVKKTS
ncbi:MAG: ABC transporter permease [Eubacterium sp.]|nr:ABC transporter permease [Eubacterium sp.]